MARPIDRPRILVLEGLSETADIIEAAGGYAVEAYPWDIEEVARELTTDAYHGLVLTGGSDIDPRLYGAKPHKETYGVDYLRDSCEEYALETATQARIPVLGICRGAQMMCAFRGGKLTQHIKDHRGGNHPVSATPDASTFKRAIGGRTMDVVSLHHQCVRRPGKGMRIAARAPDRTPEAIESKDGLWLGVQFHPEMAAWDNGNAFAIFQWLVRAAAAHAGVVADVPNFRDIERPVPYWHRAYTPTPKLTVPKHRVAGARTVPSALDSARVFIDAGESELELRTCPECGMLFDERRDRNDHLEFVHGVEPWEDELSALSDEEIETALRYS